MFTHLYWYVQHKAWLPCVSHTHHSDPIGIAYTHFLQTHTHTQLYSLLLYLCAAHISSVMV